MTMTKILQALGHHVSINVAPFRWSNVIRLWNSSGWNRLCYKHSKWCQYIICAGFYLTHWGRVTHICVSELPIIGSDNGLSPDRRQAIIWTNAGILLVGHLGINFSEILIEILTYSFKKMCLKVSSAKRRPFWLGLNVLRMIVSPSLVSDGKAHTQFSLPISCIPSAFLFRRAQVCLLLVQGSPAWSCGILSGWNAQHNILGPWQYIAYADIFYTMKNIQLSMQRANSIFVPSQWEMALFCNDISHWLGASRMG